MATNPNVVNLAWRRPNFRLTDDCLAECFVASDKAADYCYSLQRKGFWRVWNGVYWAEDHQGLKLLEDVRELLREIEEAAAKGKSDHRYIGGNHTVRNVERELRMALPCDEHSFDTSPWLMTCSDGQRHFTMSIKRFGGKHQPRREDCITRCASGIPEGDCPRWIEFIEEVTVGDADLAKYLQKVAGYCLYGKNNEQIMFFLYGGGNNGKSVFVKALHNIMGDYATTVPSEVFMTNVKNQSKVDEALVRVKGARLVTANEIDPTAKWNVAILKQLTGEDPLDAARKYEHLISFLFGGKLMIVGNDKPRMLGIGPAIRRRIKIIPFLAEIPEERRDKFIADKLKEECNGILKWALEGCYLWQEEGLEEPNAVAAATNEYFASQDLMSQWCDACCDVDFFATVFTPTVELYTSWTNWCKENGHIPGASNAFSEKAKGLQFDGPNGKWKLGEGHKQVSTTTGRKWGFYKIAVKV